MTSVAVTIFIMLITIGMFILPRFFKMENKYLDSTLKGLCIVFGLFLLSLDTAMIVTFAAKAKLGISRELFRLMFFINWAAYLSMAIVTLTFGWNMLQMWNTDKQRKRMGFDDEQE